MLALRIFVGVFGSLVALGTLGSAVRTVVVPRGEQSILTRTTVMAMRGLFNRFAHRRKNWRDREAIKARFAPVTLMLFPGIWASGVIIGMSGLYWALGEEPYKDALILSGSSLTTLGFRTTTDAPTLILEIIEGIVGLGIVALLIAYLPTIYAAFSRRETVVAKLQLRSTNVDGVASAESMLIRRNRIDALEDMMHQWYEWEDWFVELEETHTSFPILVFFRSPAPERSWVNAAGIALDTASLYLSTLDLPADPRAQLMVRTGTLSLRRICDYWDFDYDPDPSPDDPIAITREEYDEVYDRFAAEGVPLVEDREQAWRDFAGWRVNYDRPLLSLATFVESPPTPWSSDRQVDLPPPINLRRGRRWS
ncbi:MAG: hypothetical protein GWN79_17490 [Actinobacteria bacterium]|nr:hypothetical protein [Actinomycetota bacterium]NIS36980.1 hypothetical protein [Actinomycetota bacterium]NIT97078.1 hypothetical protein [Actinomycetota bacterium]NIU20756.1 hypothetical protein [Actinomycetota bacterium]NIU71443.1 hypothetical protein [Actinomycetota bacterium]